MKIGGLDIETTGLDWTDGHRIIELALIQVDGRNQPLGKIVQRFNPQRPIEAGAIAVHGIELAHLHAEPVWAPPVLADIYRAIESCDVLVAHNGKGFDLPFINAELMRIGMPKITRPVIDTCVDARWATPLGKIPNLGELCFACGIDYDPNQAHAAQYDVEVMLSAFFHAVRKGFTFQSTDSMAKAA